MTIPYFIRAARAEDLEQIRCIDLECLGASAVPLSQMKWLLEGQGDDPAFSVQVVHEETEDRSLLGFICWKKKESEGSLYFEILGLAVGKNFRDERIEHLLIDKVVAEATDRKCLGISVNVPHSNIAATAFYLGLGFMIQHTVKKYYDDGTDMDVMVKRVKSLHLYDGS